MASSQSSSEHDAHFTSRRRSETNDNCSSSSSSISSSSSVDNSDSDRLNKQKWRTTTKLCLKDIPVSFRIARGKSEYIWDDPLLSDFQILESEGYPFPLPAFPFIDSLCDEDIPTELQQKKQQQQQRCQPPQDHQQRGDECAENEKAKKLHFSTAFEADPFVYKELLNRHYGKQKITAFQACGADDCLPAYLQEEYLAFEPAVSLDSSELSLGEFRQRVAAVSQEIEELKIPSPPAVVTLHFPTFIAHAAEVLSSTTVAAETSTSIPAERVREKTKEAFDVLALQEVARYFGFFLTGGIRTPSIEEAVAFCVKEELRGWPQFLDSGTRNALKDVLLHSKARRFNRFPCRLAWPPIPPLCTYSEVNLWVSLRYIVKLKTYILVQDYYRTRFDRQTSIHNFAVDQHALRQRKFLQEERCAQGRTSIQNQRTSEQASRDNVTISTRQSQVYHTGKSHSYRAAACPTTRTQHRQADRSETETFPCIVQKEYSDDVAQKITHNTFASKFCPPMLPRVAPDEIIVSVSIYHSSRGTKLAAFDILASQTLLDLRNAFLGCCEFEAEPGVPFFPGSCFVIDGIIYPDTRHASSAPEYAHSIAEHLRGSGKLARKNNHLKVYSGDQSSIKNEGVTPPTKRLDGRLRVSCPALPPKRRELCACRKALQHEVEQRKFVSKKPSTCELVISQGRDEDAAEKAKFAKLPTDEDEENQNFVIISQAEAVLNRMTLPLRSLECFVHQGTCEHRLTFWNMRQFDPRSDCCFAAAYPVRVYKPSSKTITCQACEEKLACKGVLNSILCSVHNPTYLCIDCYTDLFGNGRIHTQNDTEKSEAHSRQSDGRLATICDSTAEDDDDDADPFGFHFGVYEG